MGNALIYGRGPKSLGEQLGVSTQEAKGYIQKYFSIYSGIGTWLNKVADTAVRTGISRTIDGRMRRYEFNWNDSAARSSVEREGKNTPVQGSSAAIILLSLFLVHTALDDLGYSDCGVRMVNVVHDEQIIECPEELAQEVGQLLKDKMEEAGAYFIKSVPITTSMIIADSWAEEH